MDFFQFKASLQEKKGVKEDDPCWDSHKQVGMKKKNGKDVPNCVPKESVELGEASYPLAKKWQSGAKMVKSGKLEFVRGSGGVHSIKMNGKSIGDFSLDDDSYMWVSNLNGVRGQLTVDEIDDLAKEIPKLVKKESVEEAKYNKDAVDKEIKRDPRIKGKEAKAIHRLLKGRSAKEDVQEAKKKIHSVSNGKLRADVIKLTGMDDEGDPFIVKLFKNGKHHEPADYYTDDKGDAIGTAKMMVKEDVEQVDEAAPPKLKKASVKGSTASGVRGKHLKTYEITMMAERGGIMFRVKSDMGDIRTMNAAALAKLL